MNFTFKLGRYLLRVRPAPLAVVLKRLVRIERQRLVTPEGTFWVDPASFFGQELARSGTYDPATVSVLQTLLRPGDTFIDVGANEGYFSVIAARLVGATGRVIAVEPQARLAPVLQRNFSENQCSRNHVTNVVVSDFEGTAQLFLTPDVNSGASSLAPHTRYPLQTQPVVTTTLGSLYTSYKIHGRVVIKMDIEGWEHEAILGSKLLFQEGRIHALVLEHHTSLIENRRLDSAALPQFLGSCGYRSVAIGRGHAWLCPGQSR